MTDIRIRFINEGEIRTLNAEHAAKHRRCLFTGFYPVHFFCYTFNALIIYRCRKTADEQ